MKQILFGEVNPQFDEYIGIEQSCPQMETKEGWIEVNGKPFLSNTISTGRLKYTAIYHKFKSAEGREYYILVRENSAKVPIEVQYYWAQEYDEAMSPRLD